MSIVKRIKKGEYGYRNYFKRRQLFLIALLALFILAQLGARFLTDSQSVKNILTVMAIVTVLPTANLASPLVAIARFKTPPESFYRDHAVYEEKCEMLYDLVLTTKDDVVPADAAAVHPTGIYVYCVNPKINVPRAERALNDLLKAQKLDPNLKLTTSLSSFDKRLKSLKPASEYEDDGTVEYGVRTLKSLSM